MYLFCKAGWQSAGGAIFLPGHQGESILIKIFKKIFFNFFYYFWLCWVFVAACKLPLVAVKGATLLIAVPRLLTMEASFVVEHRLEGMQVLAVMVHGPSCPAACGILGQGSNPCPLH